MRQSKLSTTRIVDFFRKITGNDEDSRIKRIASRIYALKHYDFGPVKSVRTSTGSLSINLPQTHNFLNLRSDFLPPSFNDVISMLYLETKRKKELFLSGIEAQISKGNVRQIELFLDAIKMFARKTRDEDLKFKICEYERRLLALKEQQKMYAELNELKEAVTKHKENAEEILNYLHSNGIDCFYHFTDIRNLHSIKERGGLFSWWFCQRHNIKIPNAGGDGKSRELDMRYGLHDYVRLSFCRSHPMAFRKYNDGAKLVLLKIKIDVATFCDTMFSDINAADSNHVHGKSLEALKKVDMVAVKRGVLSSDSPYFKKRQAECMVRTFIPIEYIENIDNPEIMHF